MWIKKENMRGRREGDRERPRESGKRVKETARERQGDGGKRASERVGG